MVLSDQAIAKKHDVSDSVMKCAASLAGVETRKKLFLLKSISPDITYQAWVLRQERPASPHQSLGGLM